MSSVIAQTTNVHNITVIKFINAPRYRGDYIDISNGDTLELFGISRLTKGNNEGGIRAKVRCPQQKGGVCEVIIDGLDFEVIVNYSGSISIGIHI